MKKIIILAVVLIVLVLSVGFWAKNQEITQKNNGNASKTLKIGNITLNIKVADTDAAREQGLSGRAGLEKNEGMLFVFEDEGYYSFWMKNMKFPIDIAWLDKNKKIIHIEKNVSPQSYPNSFVSGTPSLYVLETNANFFENHEIKIGDTADF